MLSPLGVNGSGESDTAVIVGAVVSLVEAVKVKVMVGPVSTLPALSVARTWTVYVLLPRVAGSKVGSVHPTLPSARVVRIAVQNVSFMLLKFGPPGLLQLFQ